MTELLSYTLRVQVHRGVRAGNPSLIHMLKCIITSD